MLIVAGEIPTTPSPPHRPLVTTLLYMDIRSLWWSTINSFEGGQLEIRVTERSGEF